MLIELSLDDDGFLRRECPTCQMQFKWFHGATENRPDDFEEPAVYFCPLCGVSAPTDQWWTTEELDHLQACATNEVGKVLSDAMRGLRTQYVTVTVESTDRTAVSSSPIEPNDMVAVGSPCHPWEPVKVPHDFTGELHCLLCGNRYQV